MEVRAVTEIGLRPIEEFEGEVGVGARHGKDSANEVVAGGAGKEEGFGPEAADPVLAVEEEGSYLGG